MNNILLIQPNALLKRLYPGAVWSLDRSESTIYLTFDDGPIPALTEWLLAELERHKAKATFFCVGENILRNRQIFERIRASGHVTANHTMTHLKGFKNSVADYMGEVEACRELTGNYLFRPPYGQLTPAQYRALNMKGYKIILWDVISYDYENISKERCKANVMNNTRNGSIVLFHDNIKAENNLRFVLPLFLGHFAAQGFSFKALPA